MWLVMENPFLGSERKSVRQVPWILSRHTVRFLHKSHSTLTPLLFPSISHTQARAEQQGSPISETLYRLLMEESRYRSDKSMANRLKQAKIPWDWTLESFPFLITYEAQPTFCHL